MKPSLPCLLTCLVLAFPLVARAQVATSEPIVPEPGANVLGAGTCAVTTTPPAGIATQLFVASAANQVVQNINTGIAGMSRVVDADLQQLSVTQAAAADSLYARLEKLQLTSLSARQMMENAVNFQSDQSFPRVSCGSMSQATAMQSARRRAAWSQNGWPATSRSTATHSIPPKRVGRASITSIPQL